MSKKTIIIISIIALLFLLIGGFFIARKISYNNLLKEVKLIDNYIDGKTSYNKAIKYINKKISNDKDMENNLDKYINTILNDLESVKLDTIKASDISDKEIINDYLNNIEEEKAKVSSLKEKEYIKQDNIKDLISMINIDQIHNSYDSIFNQLNNKYDLVSFLNTNKDNWNIINDELVFNKRKLYEEFTLNFDNIIKSKVIEDTKEPSINAEDITINKGDKLDLTSKIKCIDNVDDEVLCKIDGTYDSNKIGVYTVNIIAEDTVGNISNKTIKVVVKDKNSSIKPYSVHVLRNQNVVIVYGLDKNNKYTKIIKTFVCSVGKSNWTPTGTFKTSDKAKWGRMKGNVYAQYYTRISGHYLFHSVPYFTKNKGDLEWEEYNKLGSGASLGCVRLAVKDAKWIYDNISRGTTVKIYDGDLPSGVTKPSAIKIDGNNPNKGWDPTDPDSKNPWNN
jgi:hypothetical protein